MALRLRVLVDVDGVLCDFLNPALEVMNRLLGTNAKLEDMKTWHLFDAFDFEVTKKQQDACYDEWKKPGWCRSLPVYPGAQAGIDGLRQIADVYIVTSPMNGPTWVHERERWLQHYFGFDRKHTIHTDAKYVCSGDIIVDDKATHCVAWKQCHPMGQAVLWDQVTNRSEEYHGIRAYNWGDVHKLALAMRHQGDRLWKHRIT